MNQYNEEKVRKIFLDLLKEKPLKNIAVTEICRKAGINRTTFYKNYIDVYDLMEKTEEFVCDNFKKNMMLIPTEGVQETLTEILKMAKVYAGEFSPLFGENGNQALMDQIIGHCYSMFAPNLKGVGDVEIQMYYSFISSGAGSLVLYWLRYDTDKTPEAVAEMIVHLVDITLRDVAVQS